MAGKIARGGRPPWLPTEQERNTVRALTGYGIPADDIAQLLGVTANTLRRHCRREIDTGVILANAKAAEFLFQRFAPPAGQPVTDERAATIAAMFWLKTRARWHERVEPIEVKVDHKHGLDKLIAELDQIAARIGPEPGDEARAGSGRPVETAKPDQETIH